MTVFFDKNSGRSIQGSRLTPVLPRNYSYVDGIKHTKHVYNDFNQQWKLAKKPNDKWENGAIAISTAEGLEKWRMERFLENKVEQLVKFSGQKNQPKYHRGLEVIFL